MLNEHQGTAPRDCGRDGASIAENLPFREVLRTPATRRWLTGAAISGFVLLLGNAQELGRLAVAPGAKVLMAAHVLAYVLYFGLGPPLGWGRPLRRKLLLAAGFFVLSLPFFLDVGVPYNTMWLWTYLAVFIGVQSYPRALGLALVAALALGSVCVQLATGYPLALGFGQPVTFVSLGLMMMAFSRQRLAIRQLRATQTELAELAVAEERNRVARDMHDILGHSLTVIAVKAELAGRLLELAPEKAAQEISDLEDLARGALVDVRATVSGHRGVNVITELANARTALTAAGIAAELPGATDSVRAGDHELFGWVLREGITNVVRHSGAERCTVTLGPRFLQVDDDGVGPVGADRPEGGEPSGADLQRTAAGAPWHQGAGGPAGGTGLRGLRERVQEAGGALSIGRSDTGGFRLRLTV